MPKIVHCPQCERKLRVPDDLLGRAVKCPTCGVIFTPPAAATGSASALANAEEQTPPENYHGEGLRGTSAASVAEPFPTQPYEETSRPSRRQRFDLRPHRGTLILVLGILSILFCGFLGPVAWIMGSSDLKEIRAGRMDPEGEGTTNGGRICGMIGTVIQLVLPVCCGIPVGLWFFASFPVAH
jgi:hypothetical protein